MKLWLEKFLEILCKNLFITNGYTICNIVYVILNLPHKHIYSLQCKTVNSQGFIDDFITNFNITPENKVLSHFNLPISKSPRNYRTMLEIDLFFCLSESDMKFPIKEVSSYRFHVNN